ncbi:MarR family winged helix-turn-helix transcriptional regulator [Nocardia yamanashiensis]|uniref:MarR family winged helix-turn-helix transcriptional regulator n=1 Tax=Nocardia yamanashiensis TaxID=209247 RepID=UPI001E61E48E|nr:MarR family winged helix-turn-helix transcriptional regulator [Nocardia yamanashiensis]UGT40351.1 MarR family winged helix-turn-helix transcriptional regulator [Nocardia yamanashiensis]
MTEAEQEGVRNPHPERPAWLPPVEPGAPQPNRPMRAAAFQLAQLGGLAAQRFAERVAEIGLTPPEVGILRMIATEPGRSQRSLAAELGVVPSRVVALIDPLDKQGLIERRRSATDRRNHELHLTPEGGKKLGSLAAVALAHEAALFESLTDTEYDQFAALLAKLAAAQQLTPGVHPGYRTLGDESK